MIILYTFLMGPLTTLLNAISMLFVDNAVVSISGGVLNLPFLLTFFLMAVFGPVCEELCFRGVVYRGYLKSGNVVGAVLLSSLLFGLMHMNFNQAPYAFAIGVSMAAATARMQALQSSVAEARQTAQDFSGELANSASSADQVCDLVSSIESGAQSMESSMRLVATAQRARADATAILHGQEVNVTSLSEMEQEAARMARSRKWIKGSGDRDALVAIYDRLFTNIESQMR